MIKEYLKHISTPQTAQLLKKPKKLTIDNRGKAQSQDENDYDIKGQLINGGKLYEEQEKQAETSRGIQVALNTLGQRDRQGKQLKTDGVFGPKTQMAYNEYWQKTYPKHENHLKDIYKDIKPINQLYTLPKSGAVQQKPKTMDIGFEKNDLSFNTKTKVPYINFDKINSDTPKLETLSADKTFTYKDNPFFASHVKAIQKTLNKATPQISSDFERSKAIMQKQMVPKPVLENILAPDKVANYSKEEIDAYLKERFKDDEWAQYGMEQEYWENEAKVQDEKWNEKTNIIANICKLYLAGIPRFVVPQLKNAANSILNTKTKPAERNVAFKYPMEVTNYIFRGLDNLANRAKNKIYGTLEQNLLNYDGALPNAFLHTYWNALMSHYGGDEAAKAFATAHEVQTQKSINEGWLDKNPNQNIDSKKIPKGIIDNFTGEQQLWMDMHNNELGREIAKKIKNKNIHEELLKYYDGSEEKLKNIRKEYKYFSETDILLLHLSAEAVQDGNAVWLVQN